MTDGWEALMSVPNSADRPPPPRLSSPLSSLVANHPMVAFLVFAFGFGWISLIPNTPCGEWVRRPAHQTATHGGTNARHRLGVGPSGLLGHRGHGRHGRRARSA